MMHVVRSGGSKREGNLASLADKDRPGRELVKHLVQYNLLLEYVEEEIAHGRSCFSVRNGDKIFN